MAIDLDILPAAPCVSGPYCSGCPNQMNGVRMIPPDGNGYSGVMIVGDSGWDYEAREGRPFAGPAGQFLDKHIFRRLGVKRDAFTLTNTTWCKAPRLNFYDHAGPEATTIIEHCRPYLDSLIESIQPKSYYTDGQRCFAPYLWSQWNQLPPVLHTRYTLRDTGHTNFPSILCDAG